MAKKHQELVRRFLPTAFLTSGLCFAEATFDNSLGQRVTADTLSGAMTIPEGRGDIRGTNLFHSFEQFNIKIGESATFTGDSAVENILSRVTGGNLSTIDGLLATDFSNSNPNFFLINPAGVMFGPNASLDVQGSFHVSTANFIRMSDGVAFNASPGVEDAVLSTAPPEAFGFLGENSGEISFQGVNLELSETETFSIVGGNLRIEEDSFIDVPSGKINLISVASEGVVPFIDSDFNWKAFDRLGTIEIVNFGGGDNIDASALDLEQGGTIFMLGGGMVLDASRILAFGEGGGTVIVRGESLTINGTIDGEGIFVDTGGEGGGSVDIQLKGDLIIDGGLIDSRTGGDESRAGANILIDVGRLKLENGASIFTDTEGSNDGGSISIIAHDAISISGLGLIRGRGLFTPSSISSFAEGEGDGGRIFISSPTLTMDFGGIDVSAENTFTDLMGNAGDIELQVGRLLLTEGAQIRSETNSDGNAGTIKIIAEDFVSISGFGGAGLEELERFSGLFSSSEGNGASGIIDISTPVFRMDDGLVLAETSGNGKAGQINLDVDRLSIAGGAQIRNSTSGAGQEGILSVNAKELISISGFDEDGFPSGLFSDTGGIGAGGDISLITSNLVIKNGLISAASTATGSEIESNRALGRSGSISIRANDSLLIQNGGTVTVETVDADAGNIDLQAGTLLLLRDQGAITTSAAGGLGTGGDITIDPDFVVLDSGSTIQANALEGMAGVVDITADFFFQSPDSIVEASAGPAGIDGTVNINSPVVNIAESVAVLPESFFDASQQLSERCSARLGGSMSSFVAVGRGGLPIGPEDLAPAIAIPRDNQDRSSQFDFGGGQRSEPRRTSLNQKRWGNYYTWGLKDTNIKQLDWFDPKCGN